MTTIMAWARRKLNPTTFYYIANRSSLWHPAIFSEFFEGTEYKLVRHLISQKHSLYSPVDPGFLVRFGRGRLKQRVQQARARGELSVDELYKGVGKLKVISEDETPPLQDTTDNDNSDIILTAPPRGDKPAAASTPLKKKPTTKEPTGEEAV